MYRFRVEQRVGRSNNRLPDGRLDRELLRMMPLRKDEVLVMKSGENIVIEGVFVGKAWNCMLFRVAATPLSAWANHEFFRANRLDEHGLSQHFHG